MNFNFEFIGVGRPVKVTTNIIIRIQLRQHQHLRSLKKSHCQHYKTTDYMVCINIIISLLVHICACGRSFCMRVKFYNCDFTQISVFRSFCESSSKLYRIDPIYWNHTALERTFLGHTLRIGCVLGILLVLFNKKHNRKFRSEICQQYWLQSSLNSWIIIE